MVFMTSSTENGGRVNLVPQNKDSYFYEFLQCTAARTEGYGYVSFSLQGPAGGSVAVEIQTKESCDAQNYTSSYSVVENLTGDLQNIKLPFSSFEPEINPDAVNAVLWTQFTGESTGTWTLGRPQFVCQKEPTPTNGKRKATRGRERRGRG